MAALPLGIVFERQWKWFCRERKNRGRWKRSVPVIRKGIICVLSQSPNGSKSGRGEHRPQAIGKRRQAVGKRWLRRAESASVGDLQPQGCLHFNRCNDLCTELFLSHHQITCNKYYREHHWGQTYTFDKMWIIDRSLLTLEKYDLNILRKTIKSTSVPGPFRMRFEIRGPVALILDY